MQIETPALLGIEESILKTLTYADLFDYPLTLGEIHEGLFTETPCAIEEVSSALSRSEELRTIVHQENGFFFLEGRDDLPGLRRQRESRGIGLMRRAERFISIYSALPWVKETLISGGNMFGAPSDEDVDLFVVAESGMAWTAFLSAILLQKVLRMRGFICVNYVVDRGHLTLPEKDLFTAHQIISLKSPFKGCAANATKLANPWAARFFANAFVNLQSLNGPQPTLWERLAPLLARPLEALLRRAFAWKWRREGRLPREGVKLEAWRAKVHFSDHLPRTMLRFQAAWETQAARLKVLFGRENAAARADGNLEDAILRTVGYHDVFDFPLTLDELHRYLVAIRASHAQISDALQNSRRLRSTLSHSQGFYMIKGREELAAARHKRRDRARQLWPRAIRIGRFLGHLPFVRMVAVSGSLAMDNASDNADIDYFFVMAPGRLWIGRLIVLAVTRLGSRFGPVLCANHFVSEGALEMPERTLYMAHEIHHMVPVVGHEAYQAVLKRNSWTAGFIPNAAGDPANHRVIDRRAPTLFRAMCELPLNLSCFNAVERWALARVRQTYMQAGPKLLQNGPLVAKQGSFKKEDVYSAFCEEWQKSVRGGYAPGVLESYAARMRDLNLPPI